MAEDEFDILKWAEESNLSQTTVNKLKSEKITELNTLIFLSKNDFNDLDLAVGDKSKLRQAILGLKRKGYYLPKDDSLTNQKTVVAEANLYTEQADLNMVPARVSIEEGFIKDQKVEQNRRKKGKFKFVAYFW